MTREQRIAAYRAKLRGIREHELWECRKQNHAMRNTLWTFDLIEQFWEKCTDASNEEHHLSRRTGT